jgi:hypothetical protein
MNERIFPKCVRTWEKKERWHRLVLSKLCQDVTNKKRQRLVFPKCAGGRERTKGGRVWYLQKTCQLVRNISKCARIIERNKRGRKRCFQRMPWCVIGRIETLKCGWKVIVKNWTGM